MINFTEVYQMVFMVVVGVIMTTTMFMTMMSYMMDDWNGKNINRRTIEVKAACLNDSVQRIWKGKIFSSINIWMCRWVDRERT